MRGKNRLLGDWLSDIVHWGEKLERYTSYASADAFAKDDMAVDAATKCVEAIGEAASRILKEVPDLPARYPLLELREAYLARNQLSHGYFTVDRRLLWQIARSSVPRLVAAVRVVIRDMGLEQP